MAVFHVNGPNGELYEVTAPDDATQDQVVAFAQQQAKSAPPPSGVTTFTKPGSGISVEVGGDQQPVQPQIAAQRDAARRIQSAPDQVRALSKGFTFGFSDELDAASAAAETGVTNALKQAVGQKPTYGMKDAYGAVMRENALRDAQFAEAHPVQNIALQIAGGAVGPGAAEAARFIGGARSLGGAALRSAGVGLGMGAVAGAGNADGGAIERAKGAVGGAVTGAAVGAAAPVVGRVAQTAGRAANAALGQPFGGASRGAVARLQEALHQDGLTPAQIQQTVAEWQRSGVTPEFLNVVGENTRALIRTAGGTQGAVRNTAQGYRDRTVAAIPGQAQERAALLTPGETRTPAQFVEATGQRREFEAARNYPQWSNTPVTVPDTIKDMLRDPAGRQIVQRAMDDAVEHQDWARQAELQQLLTPTQNGQLPRISAGTIERLVQATGERSRDFAAHGANIRAAGAMGRHGQLDATLAGIPEVAPSRAAYADASTAMETAADVPGNPSVFKPASRFGPAVDDIRGNPAAMQGAQIRERQRLVDGFGTRDQVSGILGDLEHAPDVRRNLETLYGDEGARFADAAGNLSTKQKHANFIAPNTGSQTQLRGNDARNTFGLAVNVMEAMGGRIRPLLERVARGMTITERERQVLVNIGIGSPADALRALSAPPPVPARVAGAVARRVAVGAAPAAAQQGDRNALRAGR